MDRTSFKTPKVKHVVPPMFFSLVVLCLSSLGLVYRWPTAGWKAVLTLGPFILSLQLIRFQRFLDPRYQTLKLVSVCLALLMTSFCAYLIPIPFQASFTDLYRSHASLLYALYPLALISTATILAVKEIRRDQAWRDLASK